MIQRRSAWLFSRHLLNGGESLGPIDTHSLLYLFSARAPGTREQLSNVPQTPERQDRASCTQDQHAPGGSSTANKSEAATKGPGSSKALGESSYRWRAVDTTDLATLNKRNGKVDHPQSGMLVSAKDAQQWPRLEVHMKGKNDPILLEGPSNPARALVILALYRRGAEGLLKEWRDQIVSQFAGNQSIDMLELSMVDLQICKMWPIKGMLINASRPETALCCNASMPVRHAIYFGDIATATDVLGMRNRLTCYIFVLDSRGRIRWRNSGRMLADEGNAMLQAITALLST